MRKNVVWAPLFPGEQIPRILRIVERCATRLRKTCPQEKENDLSDRLRDLIDRDPEFQDRVDAELQREVAIYDREKPRQRQLGRADITFLSWAPRKPWPYFLIEAKRLHVTFPSGWQSLVPEYVTGPQGMMCFIDERYSRRLASGAMLGYVFDGEVQKACDAIHLTLAGQAAKLKSIAPHGLSLAFRHSKSIGKSSHRVNERPFVIFHLFAAV